MIPSVVLNIEKTICHYSISESKEDRLTLKRDIVLFYYYSSPCLPSGCYLDVPNHVAIRNMFLFNNPGNRIHFEFPAFEDHSYNTICHRTGVMSLIRQPSCNEKYIVLRTRDGVTGESIIVGFYKVGRSYFQRTPMFNNHGFVCGIEAEHSHLVERGSILTGRPFSQGHRVSWWNEEMANYLNDLVDKIQEEDNIEEEYRTETNRLVELFKDKHEIRKWRNHCTSCELHSKCPVWRRFQRYNRTHPGSDRFMVLNRIYRSKIYSRNALDQIAKEYLK